MLVLRSIIFGTQTGNAECYARQIFQIARYHCNSLHVVDMSKVNLKYFSQFSVEDVALLILSTAGRGQPPSELLKSGLWISVMKKVPVGVENLQLCKFALIGLGDSSYLEFNYAAKKMFRRLVQLGATFVMPMCLSDEQHSQGTDGAIFPWLDDLWIALDISNTPVHANAFPLFTVINETLPAVDEYEIKTTYTVKSNERITPEHHWQDVRLLSFNYDMDYEQGAVLEILPSNSSEDVSRFIVCTGINANLIVSVKDLYTYPKSIIWLLYNHFDLKRIPDRGQIKRLYQLLKDDSNTDADEIDRLLELSKDYDDYISYCRTPRRTIVELLEDFRCASRLLQNPSILFELLYSIRPRYYCICSNSTVHKGVLQILFVVVQYHSSIRRKREGLCSNWLASLTPNNAGIVMKVGKYKSFVFEEENPLIMIGPGTGISPFRNISYGRWRLPTKQDVVFFGCRNKSCDLFFEGDWKKLCTDEKYALSKFIVAFSRDQTEKIYVQHKIKENQDQLSDLILNHNAYILICGSSLQMPENVIEAIVKCIEHAFPSLNDAKLYMESLRKKNRIQIDTWS
ncbi:hypothetical protein GJ496_005198 [Pomphorhynchus laevis]|nr:hypothetical protein GJ496_005198 [Pomphorhynchus laevis]